MKKFPVTQSLVSLSFQAIILAIIAGRAGQAHPPGGPAPPPPPAIIESYPLPNALNVRDRKVVLSFSKYVDRSSLERSIFFSPPAGTPSYDWGGTSVEISFPEALRQDRTYILTVGTDVVDLRNHNRMASAFALPFSTGERIDSASIAGVVFSEKPEGLIVFAYKLDGMMVDTLNPAHTTPDYLAQTGKEGRFTL